MKQLIAFTIILLMLSAAAHAQSDPNSDPSGTGNSQGQGQGKGKGKQGGGDRMARMQKNLGLSDEQVTQIREIRQRNGTREEVQAIFTDEQRALIQERRRQAKSKQGTGEPGRYYSLPPDKQAEEPDGS
jgi:Spy/CpxP family protein refolding chaperone